MGLSCKQVSSDKVEWIQGQSLLQAPTMERPKASSMKRRHHQENKLQQSEPPLKCPRCDSSNTKFCYYNNYNKSQPRYFCKTCKRHWTKGGNLRNVPVGGGRKNKRHQTSAAASASKTTTTTIKSSTSSAIQSHQLPPCLKAYRLHFLGRFHFQVQAHILWKHPHLQYQPRFSLRVSTTIVEKRGRIQLVHRPGNVEEIE